MPQKGAKTEVWILGAAGRVGSAVAARIAESEFSPVLVGRDEERLRGVADAIGGRARVVVAASLERIADAIRRERPAVVLNTVGPFSETAAPIATACLHGTHYADLANDIVAVPALLAMHEEAVSTGTTLVTGAAFGFVATEAVVAKLCADRPVPSAVRVDSIASVELEAGTMGRALAASVVESLALGGRRYDGGRLVKSRLGSGPQRIAIPDGGSVDVASVPTGDLHAAWATSDAPSVTATSSEIPTGLPARVMLPLVGRVLSLGPVRDFATRRLAGAKLKARARPRDHSWGHAQISWADGSAEEGWLRAPDAMVFTSAVAAEVATRLARGAASPGAYTPSRAFGHDIAVAAGAQFASA